MIGNVIKKHIMLKPTQVEDFVKEATKCDFDVDVANNRFTVDAKSILGWDKLDISFVSGSKNSSRMNEYKTHFNWAERICYLAKYYGIK